MNNGLAGHTMEFYQYVKNSSWTGGDQEYSTLNEAFPYWYNAIVPLAYSLDDATLKSQIQVATTGPDGIVTRQQSDGWIGPETGSARNFWARYPTLLGMIQLVQADASYKPTVLPAMHKFFGLMNTMLKNNLTGLTDQPGDTLSAQDHTWGQVRVCDMMISVMWLYENDPQQDGQLLLDNLNMLRSGQLDWADWYKDGVYLFQDLDTVPVNITNEYFPYEHGVNVATGFKAGAVINRFANDSSLPDLSRRAVNWTNTYHGTSSGTLLGDERIEGLSPYSASELCTAVEMMYSLSYLYQTLGDAAFADQAEKLAFNAMPAQLTPDWWAHTYGTQPNGPYSMHLNDTPFWNMNGYAQTYGLEPDYPCCTVNHPQGYPKFVSAMFVQNGNNGLAHGLLSPGSTTTTLPSGNNVSVSCDTQYPFGSTLAYTITASSAFDFSIRIPSWANLATASISVGGKTSSLSPDAHSGLHTVSLGAGSSSITVTLWSDAPPLIIEQRANDSVSVFAGPLLYSLQITAQVTTHAPLDFAHSQPFPAGYAPAQALDYVMMPTTPWNYAIDTSTLVFHTNLTSSTNLADPIWAPGAPPTWLTAEACQINWPLYHSVPGPVPPQSARQCQGGTVNITMVPYASAKLHMIELPTVSLSH